MPTNPGVQDFIKQINPVIDLKVRGLCKTPYFSHPKGCPNFGLKESCPPLIKLYNQIYDVTKPVYVIYNTFDLASHVEKLRQKHPQWTRRQLECTLYWQGTARKRLREKIDIFKNDHPEYEVTIRPEAMGVNVTETMKQIGIELEWPPTKTVFQVAMAAVRL